MRQTPRLRELRESAALSQEGLAEQSGVSRATIADLEAGKRPARPSTLRKLADALDVAPADMFAEAGPAPKVLSLSSPRVRRWLRERGAHYALMSEGEFAEYAVKQPLDVDHGTPEVIERMLAEIKQEEESLRRALKRAVAYPSVDLWDVPHAPDTVLGRDSEVRRFTREELDEHFRWLRNWLIRYSQELYDRGVTSNALAPNQRFADKWRAEREAREAAAEAAFQDARGA